jgi:hypothetical protein
MNTYSGVCLEKVCEYLYYHEKNKDARDVPDMDIPADICLEMLVAADFLDGEFAIEDSFDEFNRFSMITLRKMMNETPSPRRYGTLWDGRRLRSNHSMHCTRSQ